MRAARRIGFGFGGLISVSLLALSAAASEVPLRGAEEAVAVSEADSAPVPRADAMESPVAAAASDQPADPSLRLSLEADAATGVRLEPAALPGEAEVLAPPSPAETSEAHAAEPAPALPPPAVAETSPAAAPELVLPETPAAPVLITDADRLRSIVVVKLGELDRLLPNLPRKEREALAAFYGERAGETLWTDAKGWVPAAKPAMQRLKGADEDGLDPADYPVPGTASTPNAALEDWAEAELKLSAAAIAYARDARGARVEPSRLSNLITPTLAIPSGNDVLAALSAARNPGEALAAYNPPHAGYRALKARLAEIRSTRPGPPMVRVPQGPALRVGMRDPRVPLVRARFNLGPESGDLNAYDERVASAVAAFQKQKGLPASGILNAQTVAALSGPSPARLEGDLIANMERWRWLPADLGSRHIFVNIPEYRLRVLEGGNVVHQTRVIVGKTESATPIFSDQMEYLVVNPSWTVPPSIMKKEFLPALAQDPFYAERKGYKVIRRGNSISVQQPPGERNALGFVKFMFPNQHAVYLHDTPNRSLFGAERRAFSHGCVRVDQPFRLAEEILGRGGSWTEQRLRGLVGKGERHIRLAEPLPVHLAYFTLAVDEQGNLKSYDDLYGVNQKLRAALGLGA